MFFLLAVTITLCAIVGVWIAEPSRWGGDPPSGQPSTGAAGPVTTPAPADPPRCLEGLLVRQVMAGEITRHRFRREMERLAAVDARRNPLVAPQDR